MKGFKFNVSGKTAFFRKSDINQHINFSYSNIHKPCILGLLGAIIGLDKDKYYHALKHLRIAIVPNKSYFNKSIQVYNNTTKFGNKSLNNPTTLNIREQWLEDVSWYIYVITEDDDITYDKIYEYIKEFKSVYNIYLGRKEHIANVRFIEDIDIEDIHDDIAQINSLFPYSIIKDIEANKPEYCEDRISYFLKETMPIGYDDKGLYDYDTLVHTNHEIYELNNTNNIYKINNNILYFL
ncbi:CRISPR-associated protein Cas5 [Clostridium botulinum]|uniref:CRISPR-associated protein Cas5 n=1 Tax=Clostridium botulinum TaxID=1491 RepID=A0A9Q1ZBD8_CLOBO|nr:type I-B CRISPR-associated protein Cas5b [Clostridium botulinum]AEB77226.1 CRISPR-associated protein Cas5, hmari subtype [Clostridium botulinum BKT015925]KEH96429.1 CRISPR-associated protein Cas5 [Clostridium botulinum C/D str. Sp77]KLU74329.1 CRISPR-associated protein Cas5, hmari subtype [Clostridium botulinum V891]KOA72671.1 CRISPR-associated protein Cas5 [Clostridium botulinum]KOA77330.1 CRISPR-associated protein Cas5 [Clostridium botulinum]